MPMNEPRLCNCGSGKAGEEVYDARGIYVARVCSECREEKLSYFNPEIFTLSYECNEQIEED